MFRKQAKKKHKCSKTSSFKRIKKPACTVPEAAQFRGAGSDVLWTQH